MNILFRWSLVGNRILPLRLTEDGAGGFMVFSESNQAVLYFCAQLGDYELFLTNLAVKLATTNGEVIGMRLIHPEVGEPLLIAGLESPVAIPLKEPTNHQWRTHLEQFFVKFQENSAKEKEEKESLQNQLQKFTSENEQMKKLLEWQTTEIELLRLLMNKPKETKVAENHSHCDSCNCGNEEKDDEEEEKNDYDEMDQTDQPTTSNVTLPVPESPESLKPPVIQSQATPAATVTPTTPSTPITPAAMSALEKKNKSEELLWGVAQYIFCQLCPEQASDVKGMENHFMTAHVDKEKRNCEACPTETLFDVAGHMQQHTSRVYACEFCGKRGRKHFLKSHIRTHTGERPFACQTCGRSFADASTLRRHQLVHSGVKKHNCPICGVGIARKDNVKVHIRSHGTDAAALLPK